MKKILKKEVIIAFIVGIILASSIAVYAYSYAAKDVSYTKPETTTSIDVETALNDLYSKSNKTPQQVATFNAQGQSYTFQNNGYIQGTMARSVVGSKTAGAYVAYDTGIGGYYISLNDTDTHNLCLYVQKGTTVTTRADGGVYNLTLYEFK